MANTRTKKSTATEETEQVVKKSKEATVETKEEKQADIVAVDLATGEPVAEAAPADVAEAKADEVEDLTASNEPASATETDNTGVEGKEEASLTESEAEEAQNSVTADADSNEVEKILKIAEEVKEKGEEIANIQNITPETEDAIKSELQKIEEIKENLEADIKKQEKELKAKKGLDPKKIFGYGFGDYWNGVSDGWNN